MISEPGSKHRDAREPAGGLGTPLITVARHGVVPCLSISWEMRDATTGLFDAMHRASINRLASNLTLIKGVGPATAAKLARRGVHTLLDACHHGTISSRRQAATVLDAMNQRNARALLSMVGIHAADALPFVDPAGLVVVDIETTGLRDATIFLIALGTFEDGGRTFRVTQFLAREPREECAVVGLAMDVMREKQCIVSFNGKAFDLPLILDRAWYFFREIVEPGRFIHVDMLHETRHLLGLPKRASLGRLERDVLHLDRDLDVPSSMIPSIFARFVDEGVPDVLCTVLSGGEDGEVRATGAELDMLAVIHHNVHDTWSLVRLLREGAARCLDRSAATRRGWTGARASLDRWFLP